MQGFKNNCLKILASSKISFQINDKQKQGHLCRYGQIEVLDIHLKHKMEIKQFNTEAILFRPIY